MSSNNYFYVRLKSHDPKRGYGMVRYHFLGNLFQGGQRPVWYKVDTELAKRCSEDRQENGNPTFDVVSEAEKLDIDAEEERRRLVSMGLLSATASSPRALQALDIRTSAPMPINAAGRFDAIPKDGNTLDANHPGVTTSRELGIGAK